MINADEARILAENVCLDEAKVKYSSTIKDIYIAITEMAKNGERHIYRNFNNYMLRKMIVETLQKDGFQIKDNPVTCNITIRW